MEVEAEEEDQSWEEKEMKLFVEVRWLRQEQFGQHDILPGQRLVKFSFDQKLHTPLHHKGSQRGYQEHP